MTPRTTAHLKKRLGGFSLPEVALAIGIAGVALISIIGLMPSLLNSDRVSGLNTALPQLMTQTLGQLRTDLYPASIPDTGIQGSMFFTESSEFISKTTASPPKPGDIPSNATYTCSYTLSPIPTGPTLPSTGGNSCLVKLEFLYSLEKSKSRVFYATLSKH